VLAQVAIVYLPEEQVDADKVKQIVISYGRECICIPQDIRDEAGCKRIIETCVQAWGRIDILVNNASVMVRPRAVFSAYPLCISLEYRNYG
jgi:NAD(P)-dependent dehydrogenase (short-subunit alcohol dehydrogenase family)